MAQHFKRGYARTLKLAGLLDTPVPQRPSHLVSLEGHAIGGAAGVGASYLTNEALSYLGDKYAPDLSHSEFLRRGLSTGAGLATHALVRDMYLNQQGYDPVMKLKSRVDGTLGDDFNFIDMDHWGDAGRAYLGGGVKDASWKPDLTEEQWEALRQNASAANVGALLGATGAYGAAGVGHVIHAVEDTPHGKAVVVPYYTRLMGDEGLASSAFKNWDAHLPSNSGVRKALMWATENSGKSIAGGALAGAGLAIGGKQLVDVLRERGPSDE